VAFEKKPNEVEIVQEQLDCFLNIVLRIHYLVL
jgi:hypothetical protein